MTDDESLSSLTNADLLTACRFAAGDPKLTASQVVESCRAMAVWESMKGGIASLEELRGLLHTNVMLMAADKIRQAFERLPWKSLGR